MNNMQKYCRATAQHSNEHHYTFIDLFAGAGGFHLALDGLAQCVMASEWDEQARFTYALNFGEDLSKHGVPFVSDINGVDPQAIPDHTILCGGFPCQPFSTEGTQIGFDHERGNLFFSILRILHAKKPRVVFLENVKNLLSHDGGKTFAVIQRGLTDAGYLLKYQVLDGAKYGNVPQHRERVFLVGFREQHDCGSFVFPEEVERDTALSRVVSINVRQSREFYRTDPSRKVVAVMKASIKEKNTFYQYRRGRIRQNKSGVCPTLMACNSSYPVILDDFGIRTLTPRECFNLQGFPSDFVLPALADCHLYKQAGNSVVVPVVRRVAQNIVMALNATIA